MSKTLKKYYYWPRMQQEIEAFVKTCATCQKCKYDKRPVVPMEITTTAESSFDKIYIDLVQIPQSFEGNRYILSVQDELSKYIEALPIRNKEADTVAKALVESIFLKYGIVKIITSDQGTEFINKLLGEVCKLLQVKQLHSTAYHPQSIGALENSHKTLAAYLRSYTDQHKLDWDRWLPYYVFCWNTTVHSSTGYTPFELVYGKKCTLPSNLRGELQKIDPCYNFDNYANELRYRLQIAQKEARETLQQTKHDRKINYDVRAKEKPYNPGTLILLRKENRAKLDEIYSGPFEVIADKGVNCEIKIGSTNQVVHKNRVKEFHFYDTEECRIILM